MQKVKEERVVRYPRLRIFKDDIEQLFELFSQNFKQVEITIDGYKTKQFIDIASIKKPTVPDFSISGHHDTNDTNYWDENIYLFLKKERATLTLRDKDSILLLGLEQRINAILNCRKRKAQFFAQYWYIALLLFLILEIALVLINNFTPYLHGIIAKILIYLIPVLIGLIWFLIYMTLLKAYTIIELKDSKNRTNFFMRNKDTLLVNIIIAFVSIILGVFGTLIIQWVNK